MTEYSEIITVAEKWLSFSQLTPLKPCDSSPKCQVCVCVKSVSMNSALSS